MKASKKWYVYFDEYVLEDGEKDHEYGLGIFSTKIEAELFIQGRKDKGKAPENVYVIVKGRQRKWDVKALTTQQVRHVVSID